MKIQTKRAVQARRTVTDAAHACCQNIATLAALLESCGAANAGDVVQAHVVADAGDVVQAHVVADAGRMLLDESRRLEAELRRMTGNRGNSISHRQNGS